MEEEYAYQKVKIPVKRGRAPTGGKRSSVRQLNLVSPPEVTTASFSESGKPSSSYDGDADKALDPRIEKAKGLRHFSIKVCEKVESKGRTTYNEVADELVMDFNLKSEEGGAKQEIFEEKNIRRRVYDALNVLMALDIISKEKKEIQWQGFPKGSENTRTTMMQARLEELKARVAAKEAELKYVKEEVFGYQKLVKRNEERGLKGGSSSTGVAFPFLVVQAQSQASVQVMISEDMQSAFFDFKSTPFRLYNDSDVIRAMGMCNQEVTIDAKSEVNGLSRGEK